MADIIIVGGGAAGMMAAVAAAKADKQKRNHIILLEKNEKLGKKLFITGKGRCNVTNACEIEAFFSNIMGHAKFLYSAIYGFDNQAVMQFFEAAGCPLKIERGQRVFPKSDHSSDIIKALEQELKKLGVQIRLDSEVQKINAHLLENVEEIIKKSDDKADKYHVKKRNNKKKLIQNREISDVEVYDRKAGKKEVLHADKIIIATGGCSYVLTGSTGDGYRFAEDCGHNIVPTAPALVPFSIKETWCYALQGLSLKNVQASVELGGKQIFSGFGEMLFTHYGVSGPLILSASSFYVQSRKSELAASCAAKLFIDLKPALSYEQLDKRILREFDENKNKQFKNAICSLFPAKLVPVMPLLAEIDPDKKVNEITREERERFVYAVKHMGLTITGIRDYDEAIITKGGVETKEISPSTMESKLVKGLYFAGEVIDVDALTGGFNLQIAWSTGYLAGLNAVLACE